jgi:hypothetical protein
MEIVITRSSIVVGVIGRLSDVGTYWIFVSIWNCSKLLVLVDICENNVNTGSFHRMMLLLRVLMIHNRLE